jgi:hypothetical protein
MPSDMAACYRLYAANCLEIAENIRERDKRIFLLRMAQGWSRLAEQIERTASEQDSAPNDGASASPAFGRST